MKSYDTVAKKLHLGVKLEVGGQIFFGGWFKVVKGAKFLFGKIGLKKFKTFKNFKVCDLDENLDSGVYEGVDFKLEVNFSKLKMAERDYGMKFVQEKEL